MLAALMITVLTASDYIIFTSRSKAVLREAIIGTKPLDTAKNCDQREGVVSRDFFLILSEGSKRDSRKLSKIDKRRIIQYESSLKHFPLKGAYNFQSLNKSL